MTQKTFKTRLKAILQITRLHHSISGIIAGLTGGFIVASLSSKPVPVDYILVGIWIPPLFISGTFLINDYVDREVDIANKRMDRPLARGDLNPQPVLIGSIITFILGAIICLYFGLFLFIGALGFMGLSYGYSLYLKKYGFIGNIVVAICFTSPYLLGGLIMGLDNSEAQVALGILSMMAFIVGLGREILKDIEDVEGDTASTIPRTRGTQFAAQLVTILFLLGILLSPIPWVLSYDFTASYIVLIAIFDVILLYVIQMILMDQSKETARLGKRYTLYALLVGMLAFFIGTLAIKIPKIK